MSIGSYAYNCKNGFAESRIRSPIDVRTGCAENRLQVHGNARFLEEIGEHGELGNLRKKCFLYYMRMFHSLYPYIYPFIIILFSLISNNI